MVRAVDQGTDSACGVVVSVQVAHNAHYLIRPNLIIVLWYNGSRLTPPLNGIEVSEAKAKAIKIKFSRRSGAFIWLWPGLLKLDAVE